MYEYLKIKKVLQYFPKQTISNSDNPAIFGVCFKFNHYFRPKIFDSTHIQI